MTDPMRPIDGDHHKIIVANIVEQMVEMGCPAPTEEDVGCHYAMVSHDSFVVGSKSASCDEPSPVCIEIVVSPNYMMDNMETIGKVFATLPILVKKSVQKAREENTGNGEMFSATPNSNKPQLLN